jgi:Flp pilus assembly protein TadG
MRKQDGIATVEFAIIGLLVMVVLFGVLETGRLLFVVNTLSEATRRGARVAAVCQVNDPGISEVTIFNASGGGATSSLLSGLTTADINVEYLNRAGGQVNDLVADYGLIEFVRVQIQGFQHRLIIPLFAGIITLQDFSTTLPRESLGVWPQGFSPC